MIITTYISVSRRQYVNLYTVSQLRILIINEEICLYTYTDAAGRCARELVRNDVFAIIVGRIELRLLMTSQTEYSESVLCVSYCF